MTELLHLEDHDIVVIDGVRVSCEMLKALSQLQPGTWIRVEGKCGDKLMLTSPSGAVAKTFNAILGIG